MSWRILLAAVVTVLAPGSAFAQYGGMGGMGGGAAAQGGMGMRMGGMGMGGMGMGGMGMGGFQTRTVERAVQVEMEGGQKLSGKLQLDSVTVDTDVGQYQVKPERVKILRLSRGSAKSEDEGNQAVGGVVITTTDKEIKGKVHSPSWVLEVEFGTLHLDPAKVRTMTFSAPAGTTKTTEAGRAEQVSSSVRVTPIEGPAVVALMVAGPRITRIAAAREMGGDWSPIDLREPVEGRAVPIVGQNVVAYGLGRWVYAFSSEANRWDVLELGEGARATPIVGPGSVRVQHDGQIYDFTSRAGKWKHIDTRAILTSEKDQAGAGKP
jgi:hypothetical protein